MTLNHVANRAGLFIAGPTAFDADCFGIGDLNVIDIFAVPDGLEDAVGKTKDQKVLHRLFAEVMIDAINLWLLKDGG